MLVLKITNAPEVVASKIGRFLEALTPDALDEKTIEDVLIKELIKNLSAEANSISFDMRAGSKTVGHGSISEVGEGELAINAWMDIMEAGLGF